MNDLITTLSWFNDIVFVSLVNTSLQVTLLIPLVALFIWMFRVRSAATRYCLWLFALFAISLLPLLAPFIPQIDFTQFRRQGSANYEPGNMMRSGMGSGDAGELPEADGSVPSTDAARASSKGMDVSLVNPVSVAYFIWCTGMLFMSWVTIGIYRKLRMLGVRSSDVKDETALETLSRLRDRLSIRRTVSLKASSEIYSPISMGIFHPVIIIPDNLIYGSSDQLEMVLTHELAHVRRCDYLISLLQNVLRAILFFHPLFHLMNRNLAKEREHVCDDWVIDVTRQRSKYAECIIGLLEKAVYQPANISATIAMAERKRDIPGRIEMIVDKERGIITKASKKAIVVAILIGCLALPVIGGIGLVRFAGARPASDEGIIVFKRWMEGRARACIWIMDADGENQEQLTIDGYAHCPVWSPDGSQIVFYYAGTIDPAPGIYIMSADGSNMKPITDSNNYCPAWSPDGNQIVFQRIDEQRENSDIYVMDADGSNEKKLTDSPLWFQSPDWSPDGAKIAFYQSVADGPGRVWVMDADGSNQKMIYDWGYDPAWSPDGKKIAFSSERFSWQAGRGIFCDILVMDVNTASVTAITQPDSSNDFYPKWSPDGSRIAFSSNRDGNYEMYVMDADGSNIRRLTNTSEDEFESDWTAFSYSVEPTGKLRATWGKIKRGLLSR